MTKEYIDGIKEEEIKKEFILTFGLPSDSPLHNTSGVQIARIENWWIAKLHQAYEQGASDERKEILNKIKDYTNNHHDKWGNIHYDGLTQFLQALQPTTISDK